MPEACWSDLAVAAAAADKPSSGSANPILTGPQAARRSAHKVQTLYCLLTSSALLNPSLPLVISAHTTPGCQRLHHNLCTLAACITCCRQA